MPVDFGRHLSFIISGSPLPFFASVWLRTSQSLLGDLQHVYLFSSHSRHSQQPQNILLCQDQWISGELSVLFGSGTHPSLDRLVFRDIGSTYWQWLVGLVCPQKRHLSRWEHWVEWPWHPPPVTTTTNLNSKYCVSNVNPANPKLRTSRSSQHFKVDIYTSVTLMLLINIHKNGIWTSCQKTLPQDRWNKVRYKNNF